MATESATVTDGTPGGSPAPAVPALLPLAATLLALAGIRDGERVLDSGCGDGLVTHAAAAAAGRRGRTYGVDPDPALLDRARRRRPSEIQWLHADPARLPLAGDGVDKVICSALDRAADPAAVLAELCRVLVRGGRAVVWAWEPAPDRRTADLLSGVAADAGLGTPEPPAIGPALPELMAGAGFRVSRTAPADVVLPFADPEAFARDRLPVPVGELAARARERAVATVVRRLGPGPVLLPLRARYAVGVAALPGSAGPG